MLSRIFFLTWAIAMMVFTVDIAYDSGNTTMFWSVVLFHVFIIGAITYLHVSNRLEVARRKVIHQRILESLPSIADQAFASTIRRRLPSPDPITDIK